MKSVSGFSLENQRLASIRAGFVGQGTSLHAWCIANEIDSHNARKAILRKWNGPKADALIQKLLLAAGVTLE